MTTYQDFIKEYTRVWDIAASHPDDTQRQALTEQMSGIVLSLHRQRRNMAGYHRQLDVLGKLLPHFETTDDLNERLPTLLLVLNGRRSVGQFEALVNPQPPSLRPIGNAR